MNAKITFSNMRGKLVMALMALLPAAASAATDYGVTVAGVKVTSNNYSNVTGTNIKPLDASKASYVKYAPSTKTLTLRNVKLYGGDGNSALVNENCSGLTICLSGENHIYSYSRYAMYLKKNTNLVRDESNVIAINYFYSYEENAIYIQDKSMLTLSGVRLGIFSSKGNGIKGRSGDEKLTVEKSVVEWLLMPNTTYTPIYNSKNGIKDINTVKASFCHFALPSYFNVKKFDLSGDEYMKKFEHTTESSTSYNAYTNSSSWSYDFMLTRQVYIDESKFPDANLRKKLKTQTQLPADKDFCTKYKITSSHLLLPVEPFTTGSLPKGLTFRNADISSLDYLGYFTHINAVDCSYNNLDRINFSGNKNLSSITCIKNKINGSGAGWFIQFLPDRTGKEAGDCYFKDPNNDENALTKEQVAAGEKKNWKFYYYSNTVSRYYGEDPTSIDNVTTGSADTDAPMYNLSGQRVGKDYKGVVIQNGKKRINR